MSLTGKLRKLILCLVLGGGSIMGVPMRPNEIEELMRAMNQPRVEITIREEDWKGDDPTADSSAPQK